MPDFDSDGTRIHYELAGEGAPIVLVHGFAASGPLNWGATGWIELLTGAGRRVVTVDCRGHGKSDAAHDPQAYAGSAMALDVIRLLDHLSIERADQMGYSMGAAISGWLIANHPERFWRVILAGNGAGVLAGGAADRRPVADELARSEKSAEASPTARAFRAFAEQGGNDLQALAAIMRSRRTAPSPAEIARFERPVLVVLGEKDDLVGDPQPLVDALHDGRLVRVPGDHLTAVAQRAYKDAVLEFLAGAGSASR